MKITNSQVQHLYNWLNLPLHGQESRSRNQFIKIIQPQYTDSLDGRTEILKKYADKDEKGEAKIENGVYVMNEEVLEKAKKEITEFLDKSTTYTPKKNDKIFYVTVKNILANIKHGPGFDIATGIVYDEVMEEFENTLK